MIDEHSQPESAKAHAGAPRLELRGITKAFGEVPVLRGIDMRLEPGEIHGLLGQNGAGKSTLTRVLAGGFPDYRGTIAIDGETVDLRRPQDAQANGIAVIYQEFSLVPQLTVAENILLGVEPGRVTYSQGSTRRQAATLLEAVGMAEDVPIDAVVGNLSTSLRQRVEIAKALSRNARLLVLDEPTSRLGGAERDQLWELMRRIAGEGTSLIFISHFLEEVLAITSRLTVLRDGAVVLSDRSEDQTVSTLGNALLGQALAHQEAEETKRPSAGTGETVLRASGVACGRRVKDVDIDLHAGEIVGLAGLIGSGRTTLAKALVGAVPLDAGNLELRGKKVRFRNPGQALRAGVALVPEDRRTQGLVGVRPASENIALMSLVRSPSKLGFIGTGGLRKAAEDAIEQFEVRPAEHGRPGSTFSGGNQQKLLLARAIMADADVLVIDQPTAGVDVGTKAQIHRILHESARRGKAILCVSDEIDEILGVSDRILVMRDGRLVAELERANVEREELIELMAARTADAA